MTTRTILTETIDTRQFTRNVKVNRNVKSAKCIVSNLQKLLTKSPKIVNNRLCRQEDRQKPIHEEIHEVGPCSQEGQAEEE